MTTSPHLTFDQLVSLARANQDQAAAAAAETDRQERQRNIDQLRTIFPLTESERAALGVTFHTYSNSPQAYARISQVWGEHHCVIAPTHGRRDHWDADVRQGENKVYRLFSACSSAELRDQLVLAIAEYRTKQDRLAADAAERRRQAEAWSNELQARAAAARAEDERRAAAIEALRAQVLAEHAVIQAEVDAQVAAARVAAWVWPASQTVTLYHWRWQTAGVVDSDGCLVAEHDEGWSFQAEPDADNFVLFQPQSGRARPRVVRPGAYVIVEHNSFSSVAELPRELRWQATIEIPGIDHPSWNDPIETADGDRVDVRTSDGESPLIRGEGLSLTVELGKEPLPWIREMLDAHQAR